MRRQRPFGVSVVAVILALSAPTSAFVIILERLQLIAPRGLFSLNVDYIALAVTVLGLAIAVGLWRLKHWAWVAAMLWTGTMLAAGLVLYRYGRHDYVLMIAGLAIVLYINQRDVQQAFVSPDSAEEQIA